MSYIVPEGPSSAARRRRRPWIVAAIVAVIALIIVAFAIGRSGAQSGRQAPPPGGRLGEPDITWISVGTQAVPISVAHGPRERTNGLAAGFTHDEVGAALAAINIAARTSKAAGPAVYETTLLQQCVGDVESTLTGIRNQGSLPGPGGTSSVEELFYRITSGDPTEDVVVVSAAARTPESRNLGGYAEFSRTLQWIDGDWKMQVPPGRVRIIANVDGYTSLGKPSA